MCFDTWYRFYMKEYCQSLLASTKLTPASWKPWGDLQQWLQLCQRAQANVLLWLQKAGVPSILLFRSIFAYFYWIRHMSKSTLLPEDSAILVFALLGCIAQQEAQLYFSRFVSSWRWSHGFSLWSFCFLRQSGWPAGRTDWEPSSGFYSWSCRKDRDCRPSCKE